MILRSRKPQIATDLGGISQRDQESHVKNNNSPPEKVGIKLLIKTIDAISSQQQDCSAEIFLGAYNSSERSATVAFQRAYSASDEGAIQAQFSSSRRPLWNPVIINAYDIDDIYSGKFLPTYRLFEEDGTFYCRQHVQCQLHQTFDFRAFPFDDQVLKIEISLDVSAKNAVFDKNRIYVNESTAFTFKGKLEWELKEMSWKIDNQCFGEDQYQRLIVYIPIKRKSVHYIFSIFIPLVVLKLIAILAFTLEDAKDIDLSSHDQVTGSLKILITLLLTVFTLKWNLGASIPHTSYMCLVDYLFLVTYLYFGMCCLTSSFSTMPGYTTKILNHFSLPFGPTIPAFYKGFIVYYSSFLCVCFLVFYKYYYPRQVEVQQRMLFTRIPTADYNGGQ